MGFGFLGSWVLRMGAVHTLGFLLFRVFHVMIVVGSFVVAFQ